MGSAMLCGVRGSEEEVERLVTQKERMASDLNTRLVGRREPPGKEPVQGAVGFPLGPDKAAEGDGGKLSGVYAVG